ncbi:MAG TPA: hypothetical protein VGL20_01380 [Candidatus Dormibacteraeota bacterium]
MHHALSVNRSMVVAAAAAGLVSAGVPPPGPSIPASAAVTAVRTPATGDGQGGDTTTVTTTCTNGLIIVLAPWTVLPCGPPASSAGPAALVPGAGTGSFTSLP